MIDYIYAPKKVNPIIFVFNVVEKSYVSLCEVKKIHASSLLEKNGNYGTRSVVFWRGASKRGMMTQSA